MTSFEYLFSLTLYRDGQLRISGRPDPAQLPSILRMIADSIEAGATIMEEEA